MRNNDPLANLIDYVNTVKPYHTKIYEVLLQYQYREPIRATVTERYEIHTTLMTDDSISSRVNVSTIEDILWYQDVALPNDYAFAYIQDHTGNMGYDTTAWDWTQWDSTNVDAWVEITETPAIASGSIDTAGTSFTESLTIQVI